MPETTLFFSMYNKILLLLLLILLSFHLSSQPVLINWQKCYGGSDFDAGIGIIKESSNFILYGGGASKDDQISGNYGKEDVFLIWTDSAGNFIRSQNYGGGGDDLAWKIFKTLDANILMMGEVESNPYYITGYHGGRDIWVSKITVTGEIIWQKCLGGSTQELVGNDIVDTPDSGYFLVGTTGSSDGDVTFNHGNWDAWVVKLNKYGNIEWEKCYGGSFDESGKCLTKTNDGCLLLGCTQNSNDMQVNCDFHGGYFDAWLVKLDTLGNALWQTCYGGSGRDLIEKIISNTDGTYTCIGYSDSDDGQVIGHHGNGDIWILKIDFDGTILWNKCFGGSNMDYIKQAIPTADEDIVICGYTTSFDGDVQGNHSSSAASPDGWIIKISKNGELIWQQCFGGNNEEIFSDIHESARNNYEVIGYTRSVDLSGNVDCNLHGYYDAWVLSLQDTTSVGIIEQFNINSLKIFPNPSEDVINIQYSLSTKEKLIIVNALGSEIYNKILSLGEGFIVWNPPSKGIYFAHLTNRPEVQKIIVF